MIPSTGGGSVNGGLFVFESIGSSPRIFTRVGLHDVVENLSRIFGLEIFMMRKFINMVESANEWIGRIFCWVVVALNSLVVIEVIMRRFFNHPTVCNFEITKQLYALHFMIVAAFALLYGSHVSIDIIYSKLTKRMQAVIDVITYIVFFFPFVTIVLFQGIKFAAASWAQLERSWSVCASPLYPIKTVVPVTAFLLMLQGMVNFIRTMHILIKGKEI